MTMGTSPFDDNTH